MNRLLVIGLSTLCSIFTPAYAQFYHSNLPVETVNILQSAYHHLSETDYFYNSTQCSSVVMEYLDEHNVKQTVDTQNQYYFMQLVNMSVQSIGTNKAKIEYQFQIHGLDTIATLTDNIDFKDIKNIVEKYPDCFPVNVDKAVLGNGVQSLYGWLIHCNYNRFEEENTCVLAKHLQDKPINFWITLIDEKPMFIFGDVENLNIHDVAMKIDNNPTIYKNTTQLEPIEIIEQMKKGKTLYYRYRLLGQLNEFEIDLTYFKQAYDELKKFNTHK